MNIKKLFADSRGKIIILIIILLLLPLILKELLILFTPSKPTDIGNADWLNFWGTYISNTLGIALSGLIAYSIANAQFTQQKILLEKQIILQKEQIEEERKFQKTQRTIHSLFISILDYQTSLDYFSYEIKNIYTAYHTLINEYDTADSNNAVDISDMFNFLQHSLGSTDLMLKYSEIKRLNALIRKSFFNIESLPDDLQTQVLLVKSCISMHENVTCVLINYMKIIYLALEIDRIDITMNDLPTTYDEFISTESVLIKEMNTLISKLNNITITKQNDIGMN